VLQIQGLKSLDETLFRVWSLAGPLGTKVSRSELFFALLHAESDFLAGLDIPCEYRSSICFVGGVRWDRVFRPHSLCLFFLLFLMTSCGMSRGIFGWKTHSTARGEPFRDAEGYCDSEGLWLQLASLWAAHPRWGLNGDTPARA